MTQPIIAILRGLTPAEAIPVGTALIEAGIDRMEVPLNSPDAFRSIEIAARLAPEGVLIGAGQFGLLYIAINGFISPGLASLVVQTQVFFTIGLAMWLARERLRPFQMVALALAAVGLLVIVSHNTDASVTPLGLALVLAAAAS